MNPLMLAALACAHSWALYPISDEALSIRPPRMCAPVCSLGPPLRNVRIGDTFYDVLPTCPDNHDRRL